MTKCENCGSYAINHHAHGRDGSDGHLCDVCYWRKRAEGSEAETKIFILIEGGCVQAIYGDAADVEITLIDKDNSIYNDEELAFLDNLPQQPYYDEL